MSAPKTLPLGRDYLPPDGLPSVTEVNQRTLNASSKMAIRGIGLSAPPQMPFNTAWQVQSLLRILVRAKLCTQDDFSYFMALAQCEDLERIAAEAPPAASGLVVPLVGPARNGN